MQLIKFLSVKSMIKSNQIIGDLPSSRVAYSNFYKIAWPSALEALLVALIGAVDTIMVGTLGEGAIAAVGITNQPKFVLLAMIFSLNTGITAVTARRKGQQNQVDANRTVRAGIIISACISVLMAFLGYLFAGPILLLSGADSSYLPDAMNYFRIIMISIPFLAYAAIVARLGTTPYATHLICMNILSLSFCFGDGLSIAASALVGQNLGAKRPDLSIIYGKTGQRLAFMISCGIFLIFIFGRTFLVSLFSNEAAIIALGANVMILAALGTHLQTSQVVLSGCLRGAGDTAYVAITSLISVAIVRPLLTYILCFPVGLGLYGAWIALLVDQSFRFVSSYKRFSGGKWTGIAL